MSVFILIASAALLLLAYRFYSPFIARMLGVDFSRPTPSHTMQDGVDYCPAKLPILFGHHFSSIAGAGPIVGPVIALAYGWAPAIAWILLGGVFMGAVHDFGVLVASIRHGGRSMGTVMGEYLGVTGKRLFLAFLWAAMVLLIAAYLAIVAKTFAAVPPAATASVLFIPLAILFGLALYRLRLSVSLSTALGVTTLAACMAAGKLFPVSLDASTWAALLVVYSCAASVAPVWLLLQPRDYLNSFLLYALLIMTIAGILAARPAVELPALTSFVDPDLGPLIPILFVTIACGAISGYHSVVSGGTSAKQLDREADARPIGFGAMLVESLVAIIVVIVVMALPFSEYRAGLAAADPVSLFSRGAGNLLAALGLPAKAGTEFAALAVSAFVLTTLDTAARLARFAFQEFFAPEDGGKPHPILCNRYAATAVTVGAAAAMAFTDSWQAIWPIFGAANQLLAAFALLAVTLWLKSRAVRSRAFVLPMYFMFAVTLSALVVLIWTRLAAGNYPLAAAGAALLATAFLLLREAGRAR